MSVVDFLASASFLLPSEVPSSAKVYKDDCMYSFDTAENNPNGLDVCMTCFQAFARSHRNFTKEHTESKGHPLYVNITKTLKPESERSKSQEDLDERARKAPKLEIAEQKELDLYDIATAIYVEPMDTLWPTEESPDAVKKVAEQILSANSASTNDEVKAWEQEVFPCEHLLTIQTVPLEEAPNLQQCSSCDLTENLWICLTCGSIGCGREQFGSSMKGNSHALSHYEATGHQVAVKLGSLSAEDEDSCDCYCYSCNDEVKVPDLGEKLLIFGIDLRSAVKSEKNLIELNLDTNKNWQFNLDGANGETLVPVFGPGLTGIQNLGNSCYLSSVLQALFSLPAYRDFYANKEFDKSIGDPATDLSSQMIKLYDGLISGRYSKPNALKGDDYQLGIRPSNFKTLIGTDHPEFKTNKQQDASEFLLYLFDKLDHEYGYGLNKDFKFLTSSKVVCANCRAGSVSRELVDNISVPIMETVLGEDEDGKKIYEEVLLADSFRAVTAKEIIEGYKCDQCGETTTAVKQSGFTSFPENLIVSVQRIRLQNWVPTKIDVPIEVPKTIELGNYTAPSFEEGESQITSKPAESKAVEFVPQEEALNMLLTMGFPEPRCLRGLYNTGNSNAEDAMNWIFAHMDDSDIDSPFVPLEAEPASSSPEVSQEALSNLVDMGFNETLAKKALVVNNNNMNAAVEWIYDNPNDDGVISETLKPAVNLATEGEILTESILGAEPSGSTYDLKAIICHKGTTPHTGHYVAFIKVDGQWILFNDEKVVRSGTNFDEIKKNAYIYFFQKKHAVSRGLH